MGTSASGSAEAWEYLSHLEEHSSGLSEDYVFEDVEVPDSIAGQMESDPVVEIVDVNRYRCVFVYHLL